MWNKVTFRGKDFEDDVILDGSVVLALDLAGNELNIDTLRVTIAATADTEEVFIPDGADGLITADGYNFMSKTADTLNPVNAYGEPVLYYQDGVLQGKYWCQKIVRVGPRAYELEAVSAVGMMANRQHFGGIYNGVAFGDIVNELVGGFCTYSIDPILENIPCYGWLPIASVRDNLHQVCFALGASVYKDANCDLLFKFASSYNSPPLIPEDRLMIGGSLSYQQPASKVLLTEHAFYALNSDTLKTLFDNTDGSGVAASQLVQFDGPYHDLTAVGVTIEDSGVNYCVVSGTGTVTGKQYTHTRKVLEKSALGVSVENEITIDEATMVNAACSANALDRLFNYYSAAKLVSYDIVLDGESCGGEYSFLDPFGDTDKGFIKSLELKMSHTKKAAAVIATGFTAGAFGNNFSQRTVITADGTWIVPADVTKARVVLVGGGSGGWSGVYGADGGPGQSVFGPNPGTGGTRGDGGAGGVGGASGKVLVLDLTLTPGSSWAITIGQGGAGSPSDKYGSHAGYAGGETSFGAYTTATGEQPVRGVVDLLDGTVYALNGDDGMPGNAGSEIYETPAPIEFNGQTYINGSRGTSYLAPGYTNFQGGYGGGAAVGSNGGQGVNGIAGTYGSDGGIGGDADDGADGISYGCGGSGGHGGGGGGEGGYRWSEDYTYTGGNGGAGGAGGAGGDGKNGVVLIYY